MPFGNYLSNPIWEFNYEKWKRSGKEGYGYF